jgi:hypothetical protein
MSRSPRSAGADDLGPRLRAVLDSLTDEHRMLLTLREELYEGSWGAMLQDLQDRLDGRPHVFEWTPPDGRMRTTLVAHMKLIEEMRQAEAELGVNLPDWID